MSEQIILASKSPRRIELMRQHGFNPVVSPSQADENLPDFITPQAAVMYLAFLKAWDVAKNYIDADTEPSNSYTVIGSDTVVVYDNKIIGKPIDKQDAYNTLCALRNNAHQVITGVCIIKIDGEDITKECFYETTDVYFTDYSDEELNAYLETDEPYDKAGGYAIQGTFGNYISHFDGDYENVVGFPITKVIEHL